MCFAVHNLSKIIYPVIFFTCFTHNFCSGMQSFYFSKSQDAMVLQTCHEKCVSLQLDPMIWETASPRTNKPKIVIVNESLYTCF